MNYTIYLRDKSEIGITERDYENISNFLGKLKLFKLDNGQIINAVDISRISPSSQPEMIPKERRLPEPENKGRNLDLVNACQGMEKWFNALKAKGAFGEFNTYKDWCDAKGHSYSK
jgi:hypothetical protein